MIAPGNESGGRKTKVSERGKSRVEGLKRLSLRPRSQELRLRLSEQEICAGVRTFSPVPRKSDQDWEFLQIFHLSLLCLC